jgi:hypothetical protein
MQVNPYVELCAGFISKLNVSIYNYTEPLGEQGNSLHIHNTRMSSSPSVGPRCFQFPNQIFLSEAASIYSIVQPNILSVEQLFIHSLPCYLGTAQLYFMEPIYPFENDIFSPLPQNYSFHRWVFLIVVPIFR